MEILGIVIVLLVCVAVMTFLTLGALVLIRSSAPCGFTPHGSRRRRDRAETIDAAIARYNEVQTKRGRNVFFWPW